MIFHCYSSFSLVLIAIFVGFIIRYSCCYATNIHYPKKLASLSLSEDIIVFEEEDNCFLGIIMVGRSIDKNFEI